LTQGHSMPGPFRAPWWLSNPHLQTLWPTWMRPRPSMALQRERLETPDGDFLDLSWASAATGPRVLLLHGLEGSLRSHYASGLLQSLSAAGFRPVLLHYRNCGEEPNRLPRSYHSGETGDIDFVIRRLEAEGRPITAAVGVSLGGNALLKWLGEQGEQAPIVTAVAVSVPFLLADAARRLDQGLSRLYRRHLLERLRESYRRKFSLIPSPLRVDLEALHSFRDYDDQVTAPLHGFADVDDYYARCSSRQFLGRIRVPTLILHARDDPFMLPSTCPEPQELSDAVTLECSRHGGHVGFVAGRWPWCAHYWLDERIVAHLRQYLAGNPVSCTACPTDC
jgi:predicted alpha/beta-fold hydrolase